MTRFPFSTDKETVETSLLCILVNDSMSADTYYLNIMSFWILLAANRRHIRNTHTKNICHVTGSLEEGRAGRGTRLLGATSPRSASLGPLSVSQGPPSLVVPGEL